MIEYLSGLKSNFYDRSTTVKKVIILVSEATSRFKFSFLPRMSVFAFISNIMYDCAVILGRGFADMVSALIISLPVFVTNLFARVFLNLS